MALLVLNPGSTTLKFALVESDGTVLQRQKIETTDFGTTTQLVLTHMAQGITSIGCRVVHGGKYFTAPTRVDNEVIAKIEDLGQLAPLHNFPAAQVLKTCLETVPDVPVIAVFDTAFHATMPEVAKTYALPYELTQSEDLHRYGFHGLAHKYSSQVLSTLLSQEGRSAQKLVNCHLGGGASLCAILDGVSVDTTMGMTPLEGLVMATRSGDVDPGIIFHLMKRGYSQDEVENMLTKQSGLQGISGLSSDPRVLIKAMTEGDKRSRLALELYVYRAAKGIAAMTVPLGGLDGLSFSGGVGQNSGILRQEICNLLVHFGIVLEGPPVSDEITSPLRMHADSSRVGVYAIPADEESLIANEANV